MEIAVACDSLVIAEYAARCDSFMCYTVDKGILTGCRNLPNPGLTSQEAVDLLINLGFDVFIAGHIDEGAADQLCAAGIEVIAGASGNPRNAVEDFLDHTLTGAVSFCEDDNNEDFAEDDKENVFDEISEYLFAAT